MSYIRFVSELIILVIALALLIVGMNYQAARGIGIIIGSIVVALFIIELFLYERRRRNPKTFSDTLLDAYINMRIGFDHRNKELLEANDLSAKDIEYISEWYREHTKEREAYTKFWTKEFLGHLPPIGMNWASGYTPTLQKYSREIKEEALPLDEHVFFTGYKKEIELAQRILAQSGRNNVLLVGEEGVGQGFVLRGLERLIETGRTLPGLSFKRFVWLDSDAVLSGIQHPGELRERLEGIFKDVLYAGNIVLAIERIDSFFDPEFPEINDVVIPFLQSDRSQVIATTNPQSLTTRLNRADVVSQFAKITVEEPSIRHTMLALEEVATNIEERDHIVIPYQSLKKIIELADRFSVATPRPQKDIDLLGEVIVYTKNEGKARMEVPDVLSVLSQRSGIPMGALGEDEKQKLLHLEEALNKQLIGQQRAVNGIAKALKRARIEVRDDKRPIGSFLFLGPTGVGKTTAAKALATLYFGREENMVRVDLSEYQKVEDANRLIETLSSETKQHPYTLLLLDEVEKAHPKVLNLFLQVLDEGILIDMQGIKVDFRNVIIIATSNAGAEFIRTNIERVDTSGFEKELLDYIQKNAMFSPELLNRFDGIITFTPLEQSELEQIASLLLEGLTQRLKKEHNIHFSPSKDIIAFIATHGFSPEYGARPMRRVIQDTLETLIADKLLKGQLNKGDTLSLDARDLDAYAKD